MFPSHEHPLVEASLEPHSSLAVASQAAQLAWGLETLTGHHDGREFLPLPELIDHQLFPQSTVTRPPMDGPLFLVDRHTSTQE